MAVPLEKTTDASAERGGGPGVTEDGVAFPEGGWQAWTTILGAFLVQLAASGYTHAFGVYQGAQICLCVYLPLLLMVMAVVYVQDYLSNYSPSEIGWIGGVQVFLVFASGIITGRAFDKGFFHYLMIGGTLLHAFSFFMLSLSHPNRYYEVFLSQGLGGGLAAGVMFTPSLAVVSHYFLRNRPLAMGVVTSGTATGAILHTILLNKLFHGAVGFHNGVRISAGLNTGLLIVANLLMRTRLPPKKTGGAIPIVEFARDMPYLFALIGAMLIICGLFFPVFFLQLDADTHGVRQDFAFYCISVMNAASILGQILPSIYAPKYGAFNLTIFVTACMAILIYCLGAVKDTAGMVIFTILFGFFSGGLTLIAPICASLAKDMSEVGARLGVSFAFTGLVGLFATPVAGALLTSDFHWWRVIIFAGTTMLGGSGFLVVSRFFLVRRKGTQMV